MNAREIADLFAQLELLLIASLKRNMARHKAWEKNEGFEWEAWQAAKLRDLRRFRRENRAILDDHAPAIEAESQRMILEQVQEGGSEGFFRTNDRKVTALLDELRGSQEKASRAALRHMDDVYRKTVRGAALGLASGSMTVQQATDMAVKDFLRQGICCIEYKDGRRVNIASYAEMTLRTCNTRAMLLGEAQRREAMGIDTVLVSQYGACSKTCLPWQGLVYIDDVFQRYNGPHTPGGTYGVSRNGRSYPLLSVAVKAGLFHPNCRHTLTTWIEGVSTRPKPMDKAKIEEVSRLEARQRELERRVRRAKREAEGLQAPEVVKEAKGRVRAAQKKLREFEEKHGDVLRRDYWRERDTGVGQFTSGQKNDTISTRGDGMGVDITIDRFTPCLFDTRTGNLVETTYSPVSLRDLKGLKAKGWLFNWSGKDLKGSEIYKLTLKGDTEIQGLIAMERRKDAAAYHVSLAESAPHNRGAGKAFDGVGGHLFAIAAQKSVDAGYGGFIFFEAKNKELVDHYAEKFGAVWIGRPHEYSMVIDEQAAQNLLDNYTLNGG